MATFEETISTANVLVDNKNYQDAIQLYTDAIDKTIIPEQKIDIHNTVGKLYMILQNTKSAASSFEYSLSIHANLSKEKAEKLSINKATVLNNLGIITLNSDVKQAIAYHKEALGIFIKANETTPHIFTLHLANTHYSYGDACYHKKDFFMAKKQYKAAIKVYQSLDETASTEPLIANAYYNLGNIYTDEDNVVDARNNYLKALKIFRELAEKQPEAYGSLVGATFNNLAVTAKAMYKYSDAITYYDSALEQYKILIEQDRKTFLPFYAATLNSIGIIYTEQHEIKDDFDSYGLSGFSGFGMLSADKGMDDKKEQVEKFRKEKAVDYYQQAAKIYNELAEGEPETYTHYVATALHNLGVLHDGKNDYDKAETFYKEALNIRKSLAEKHPGAFNLDVCVTLLNMVTMYQSLLESKIDISYKNRALKLLKEVEGRLSNILEEKPVVLSMKSDAQYFSQYFNKINYEYLQIIEAVNKANDISEEVKSTVIPAEKLRLQRLIVNLFYDLYGKYPKDERVQEEMLNTYIEYSWLALRSNEVMIAEKAIENGLKIDPEALPLKANLAHVHLIKNEIDKAKEVYNSLKSMYNNENESFKKVLETDLLVLKNDGIHLPNVDIVKEVLM